MLVFVPQQYIVPTPIYVQPSHFYSCHTRYCHNHNHITTQPSRRHYTYIYIIYTRRFHKPFSFGKPYVICVPLSCCANVRSAATPHASTSTRGHRAHGYAAQHAGCRHTRAQQAPQCDARAPAVSRRHRTPHSETSPADPNPTELIAPRPPPNELV